MQRKHPTHPTTGPLIASKRYGLLLPYPSNGLAVQRRKPENMGNLHKQAAPIDVHGLRQSQKSGSTGPHKTALEDPVIPSQAKHLVEKIGDSSLRSQ
jgi:hypothetical protein